MVASFYYLIVGVRDDQTGYVLISTFLLIWFLMVFKRESINKEKITFELANHPDSLPLYLSADPAVRFKQRMWSVFYWVTFPLIPKEDVIIVLIFNYLLWSFVETYLFACEPLPEDEKERRKQVNADASSQA
jgi:hypothetical protein